MVSDQRQTSARRELTSTGDKEKPGKCTAFERRFELYMICIASKIRGTKDAKRERALAGLPTGTTTIPTRQTTSQRPNSILAYDRTFCEIP